MEDKTDEIWHEARLTGFGRVLRLGLSALLIVAAAVLYFLIEPELRSSPLVIFLLLALFASGIYDILKVLRTRLFWNNTGIQREGLFGKGRIHLWDDLTSGERSMHHRATVLTFKTLWTIKVYWSYRAHREIAALAKQKRKENKASRRKKPKPVPSETASQTGKKIEPTLTET